MCNNSSLSLARLVIYSRTITTQTVWRAKVKDQLESRFWLIVKFARGSATIISPVCVGEWGCIVPTDSVFKMSSSEEKNDSSKESRLFGFGQVKEIENAVSLEEAVSMVKEAVDSWKDVTSDVVTMTNMS